MASTIKVKRSAVHGKSPTTGNLEVGELALNTKDGRLYSKGTMVFEIGANNHSLFVGAGGATFANGAYTLPTADGSADQFLKTNGSGTLSFADSGSTTFHFFVGGSSVATIPISSGVVPFFNSAGNADNIGASADFVTDTTPQLGGNLDLNSRDITGTGNITITGNYTGTGNITNTGNFDLISTDAGSTAAPELTLYRNSSSPADADYLGQLRFEGENDAGQNQLYVKITGKIGDASDGTEDGILEIAHVKAGSQNISARFTSTTLKLLNGTTFELKGQDSDTRYANNTVFNSALANTNAYIATTAATERSSLANTNAYIASIIDGQTFTGDVFVGTNKFGGDATDYLKYTDNTQLDVYVNNVNQFRFENDGDLHANGDIVAFSTTVSDERLKENIEIISNAADKVSRIKGVTFTRKGGDESAGIIAQDILNILPQAVKEKSLPLQTGTDDKYYVVEYDAVTGLLVQAVKELTERVQELEKKS